MSVEKYLVLHMISTLCAWLQKTRTNYSFSQNRSKNKTNHDWLVVGKSVLSVAFVIGLNDYFNLVLVLNYFARQRCFCAAGSFLDIARAVQYTKLH